MTAVPMSQSLGPDRDRMAAAMVSTDRLRVHPRNIRTVLTNLDELATSIRFDGVLQPLIAHKRFVAGPGVQDLELIDGHRRLAAARIAGLRRVPTFILPTHRDDEAMIAMIATAISRAAVPAADLGAAVTTLHREFGYDYRALAQRLGVSVHELDAWRAGRQPRSAAAAPGTQPPKTRAARSWSPSIRPAAVHELLARRDAGGIDDNAVVAQLRSWMRDWQPKTTGPGEGA